MKIFTLTLTEFFFYIWLPTFLILLFISTLLVIIYIRKKRKLRKEVLKQKELLRLKQEEIAKLIEELLNSYEELIKKKAFMKAILLSYNLIRELILNHMEVKVPPFLTEKEAIQEYKKASNFYLDTNMLLKLYQIYEKIRFGEKEPTQEEIEEYTITLKKLANTLLASYGSS